MAKPPNYTVGKNELRLLQKKVTEAKVFWFLFSLALVLKSSSKSHQMTTVFVQNNEDLEKNDIVFVKLHYFEQKQSSFDDFLTTT
jgi:hypothetical protein